MTEEQMIEARRLHEAGRSHLEIARCLTGVTHRQVEIMLGPMPHKPDWMAPKLRAWWMQQPWVWRPDNPNPIEAPWERVSNEWF